MGVVITYYILNSRYSAESVALTVGRPIEEIQRFRQELSLNEAQQNTDVIQAAKIFAQRKPQLVDRAMLG